MGGLVCLAVCSGGQQHQMFFWTVGALVGLASTPEGAAVVPATTVAARSEETRRARNLVLAELLGNGGTRPGRRVPAGE